MKQTLRMGSHTTDLEGFFAGIYVLEGPAPPHKGTIASRLTRLTLGFISSTFGPSCTSSGHDKVRKQRGCLLVPRCDCMLCRRRSAASQSWKVTIESVLSAGIDGMDRTFLQLRAYNPGPLGINADYRV